MNMNSFAVLAARSAMRSLPHPGACLWLALALPAAATSLQLNFTVPSSVNESNRQAILEWNAAAARTYLVQSATDLSPQTVWKTEEPVRASTNGPIRWMAPEALSTRKYYRLVLPQPEVFSVEPSFVNSDDPGALLYLTGQGLPTNGSVVINGQNFTIASFDPDGSWLALSLNGLPPGTPIIGNLLVLDSGSNVVATLPLQNPVLYGTEPTAEQLQGPPDEPPASPSALLVAWLSKKGYDYYKAKGDLNAVGLHSNPYFHDNSLTGDMPMTSKKGYDYYKAQSDLASSSFVSGWTKGGGASVGKPNPGKLDRAVGVGDEDCDDDDLGSWGAYGKGSGASVGKPNPGKRNMAAGVAPFSGEMQLDEVDLALPGRGLDFAWTRSYRSRTGPNTAQGAGWDFSYNVSLTQNGDGTITLRPGNGRADTFYPDGTNGWVRDEYFVEIRDLNGDGMPDVLFADTGRWLFKPLGTPAGGKLWRIIDRNGNTITLDYNLKGQLETIVDDLDRTNTVAYTLNGKIASVTDFSGRTVRYEYDGNGDLVACVSPPVVGTPTGNDWPGGITNRYTYSSGNADDRLNHNLTSCIDGQGQTWLTVVYHPTNNPASIDFDAVATLLRGIDKKDIRRGMVIARPSNSFATVQTIVNDYLGNVTEYLSDSRQRCVSVREFTGRADPTLPTTATENRPAGKLRPEDPDFFETRWTWNRDSLCTQETLPDGGRTQFVYERDFGTGTGPRKQGDCRLVRAVASPGGGGDLDGDGTPDITELAWHFDYDPQFGSPTLSARGKKLYVGNLPFAARGPRQTTSLDGSYDGDNTPIIKGSALGAARIKHRYKGWDGLIYGTHRTRPRGWDGTIKGLAMESARIITDRDTGRSKGFGFVTAATDPRGNLTTTAYDATGNAIRKARVVRQYGGTAEFVDWFAYDAHGQLTAITNAPDANGRSRVDTFAYSQGQVVQCVEDAGAGGLNLTTGLEYDARGNVTRMVDPRGYDTLYTYNALDQCVTRQTQQSSFGERVKTTFHYDANQNLVRCDLENRDETGGLVAANPQWTTRFEYDGLDRPTGVIQEISEGGGLPGSYATNRFVYDANDNLTEARSPLAVSGADPHNTVAFEYDERGLLFREIGAPGSGNSPTNEFSYDANGRLRSGVIAEVGSGRPATMGRYDGFGRLVSITDPMSNVVSYVYDRNGNLTRERNFGETNDVPGDTGNRLLAETLYEYDSLDRLVRYRMTFFDIFTGLPIGDGSADTTFTYAPNGDRTSVTDDNGHTTRFAYDAVGRLASITDPKTNVVQFTYDACDNLTGVLSSERSDLTQGLQQFSVAYGYDALNRRVNSADNVGNTNRYAYDSRGNLVSYLDPRENESFAVFDGLGRCVATTNYVGKDRGITINTSHVEYDTNSRRTAATDSNGNTTTYAYDSLDRCVAVTEADGTSCSLIWSPRSNLLRQQDANGSVITNIYDLLDRCVARSVTPGSTVAASTTFELFAYDGLSRCVAASNNVSWSTFAFDSLGHCVRSTQDGFTSTRTYDGVGNCLTLLYPGGRILASGYNALDELTSLSSSPAGGLPFVTLTTYDYDGPDRVGRISRANNVNTRLQWNGLVGTPNAPGDYGWREISGINHQVAGGGAVIDRRTAAYDRSQNKLRRAQITPFFPGGPTRTNEFSCDALDRLVGSSLVLGPAATNRTYLLDGNGNRQVVLENGVAQPYTMDAVLPPGDFQMNQYTLTPFGTQTYDENGNLISRVGADGPTFYQYDYADRLVQVNGINGDGMLGPLVSYAYDALGRRVSRTTYPPAPLAPVTTQFVYDGDDDCDGHFLEERENGNLKTFAVWPHMHQVAGHLRISAAGEILYAHDDDLGNVLALTDAAGNVAERYDYDDYGAPQFLTSDGFATGLGASVVGNSILFQGMEWEGATGLYRWKEYSTAQEQLEGKPRHRAAYLDPKTGRPTTRVKMDGGMPNRISMNVTVPKQTQGATFGEKVNQGLHAAGGALAGKLINPIAMDKGLRFALREEGGRHTPFHNKRASTITGIEMFRKILDYGEAGGIESGPSYPNAYTRMCCEYHRRQKSGHVSLLK